MGTNRPHSTGRARFAALPAAARRTREATPPVGTASEPPFGAGGAGRGRTPQVILVSGAVREPLERQANNLIAHGIVGAAVVGGAVLVVAVLIPGPPLPWLVWLIWTVAFGCLAIAALSTAAGIAVKVGLRHAREVRRRQPPQAPPDAARPGRRVVIDGYLADPDPPAQRPMDGR